MFEPTTLPTEMPGLPPRTALETHHQLRRCGAVGDDGHANQHRRDVESPRKRNGTTDQIFRAEQEENESANKLANCNHLSVSPYRRSVIGDERGAILGREKGSAGSTITEP